MGQTQEPILSDAKSPFASLAPVSLADRELLLQERVEATHLFQMSWLHTSGGEEAILPRGGACTARPLRRDQAAGLRAGFPVEISRRESVSTHLGNQDVVTASPSFPSPAPRVSLRVTLMEDK